MKKTLFSFIIFISIIGCNDSGISVEKILETNDLNLISQKRKEIIESQQEIYKQLKAINNKIEELNKNSKFPIVETLVLKSEKFNHYVELQGNVKSDKLLIIYPEFSGILNKIYVSSGEKVIKGQLLATIQDGGLKEQLSQLEINYNLTKTTFERQERLWAQNIGSEIQFLQAKSMFEAQKNGVEQLKKQIEKTIIKAPFSGTIDNVIAKEGEVVYPGRSNIMLLLNMDSMYVESNVPEKYLNSIYKGKDAKLEFPLIGKYLNTSIRQAGNFINPNNRTYKIELNIPKNNLNIKPNLNTKVRVNDYSSDNAILIKEGFISIDSNNEKYVYKIERKEKKTYVSKTIIKIGENDGNHIEVLSGLSENDEIVSEGIRKLIDNSRVKIINN
ncbi:MAG: efflux RND transporter periplasmic adaptor subunit [Flavobacteriaceae bacterium]|jgi:RND family efflux transporter MFP subunit|nr:efflux RND transporter periplasmic adaptor subunit [Flavobacteriaceae bacterium]MBT3794746.1 efflux RND transporter periplasmic adaptor subunit [Flavobacteriaceae bacterium]MBT5596121.1 efflux RND transporter periplasmic adaptor subunit [Flavobacteriaceae bacterium]MBT5858160.1 efflux RND transporter periplasmic adaptor subunit [Flavobacteriaceae bacterium]